MPNFFIRLWSVLGPAESTTARSITFCSSRIFLGHGYVTSLELESLHWFERAAIGLPYLVMSIVERGRGMLFATGTQSRRTWLDVRG
jgi:hypothetical protein